MNMPLTIGFIFVLGAFFAIATKSNGTETIVSPTVTPSAKAVEIRPAQPTPTKREPRVFANEYQRWYAEGGRYQLTNIERDACTKNGTHYLTDKKGRRIDVCNQLTEMKW